MPSQAPSVAQYLAALPQDRRAALSAVRAVILENLDAVYEEGIQYGMIGYYVPHQVFPAGYHADPRQPVPFAALASQKNHMAVYLMCVNGQPEREQWLREAWAKTGKKLDRGKSCIRFKKLEDLALEVIGEAIHRAPAKAFLEHYQSVVALPRKKAKASGAASKSKPIRPRKSAAKERA